MRHNREEVIERTIQEFELLGPFGGKPFQRGLESAPDPA